MMEGKKINDYETFMTWYLDGEMLLDDSMAITDNTFVLGDYDLEQYKED